MPTSSYIDTSNSTITISTGVHYRIGNSIPASSLGDEYLEMGFLKNYEIRQDQINSHHTRWAGGKYVEGDAAGANFDLGSDNIFDWRRGGENNGNQREDLREVMAAAVAHGNSFSMVTNTATYADELHEELGSAPIDAQTVESSHTIEELRSNVRAFVNHLVVGDFGAVPNDFMIEVGSEYYETNVWKNLASQGYQYTAKLFGYVFAAMSDEIKCALAEANASGLNHDNVNISVAVQMGRFQVSGDYGSPQDNEDFISAFKDMKALKSVDALIWHNYRPTFDSIDSHIFGPTDNTTLEYNMGRWIQEIPDELHSEDLRLVCGWTGPAVNSSSDDANLNNFGGPSLTNILQEYSVLVNAGMDIGTIYGTDTTSSKVGSLGSQKTTYIGGQLYGLMSEALPGMHLLTTPGASPGTGGIYGNTAPTVLVDPDNDPHTDNSVWEVVHDQSVNTYAFEDDSKVVVFLAAKDFSGTSLSYTVKVKGNYSYGWAMHLYDPEFDTATGHSGINANSPGHVGDLAMPELYSGGMSLTQIAGGASTTVTFQHDFEVIRLILSKTNTGSSPMFISGTLGADSWIGTNGADTLRGQGGNDHLRGNGGNDVLDGGAGSDTLVGGTGDDTFVVNSLGDVVSEKGNGGNDTVVTSLPSYTLGENIENILFVDGVDAFGRKSPRTGNSIGIGNASDNLIVGGSGDDSLVGGSGKDTLDPGDGASTADTLRGGDGDDTYVLRHSHVHLVEAANGGSDCVEVYYGNSYTVAENFENLTFLGSGPFTGVGNVLDNLIIGGNDNDTLLGGSGNDTLRGLGGADALVGGAGDDTYVVGPGDIVSEATGEGTDSVQTLLTNYHLQSNFENLAYDGFSSFHGTGNHVANLIAGGAGDDTLCGLAGNDSISGGAGNDQIHGGSQFDAIDAGAGNDTVWGDDGRDHVRLGAGNDVSYDNPQPGPLGADSVWGGDGSDTINGGGGDDLFYGQNGSDYIAGGAGNDQIHGGNQMDTIKAGAGNDTVWGDNGRDHTFLGAGDDVFIDNAQPGAKGADTVLAGAGNDLINGGGGDDTFFGQNGKDCIAGGAGNDRIHGGNQFDTIEGGAGNDTVWGDNGRDHVLLGAGDDVFHDNAQPDLLGADTVWAGEGNDFINGGGGNDVFFGGSGNDTIVGGPGDDQLYAGHNVDQLTGGAGADEFFFFAGDGWNGISDFEPGIDKIVLSNLEGHENLEIDYLKTQDRVIVHYTDATGDFHGGGIIAFYGTYDGEITHDDFIFI
ncbi:calcium-binding protein [Acidimangrovimonas pyrenivorans]